MAVGQQREIPNHASLLVQLSKSVLLYVSLSFVPLAWLGMAWGLQNWECSSADFSCSRYYARARLPPSSTRHVHSSLTDFNEGFAVRCRNNRHRNCLFRIAPPPPSRKETRVAAAVADGPVDVPRASSEGAVTRSHNY